MDYCSESMELDQAFPYPSVCDFESVVVWSVVAIKRLYCINNRVHCLESMLALMATAYAPCSGSLPTSSLISAYLREQQPDHARYKLRLDHHRNLLLPNLILIPSTNSTAYMAASTCNNFGHTPMHLHPGGFCHSTDQQQ